MKLFTDSQGRDYLTWQREGWRLGSGWQLLWFRHTICYVAWTNYPAIAVNVHFDTRQSCGFSFVIWKIIFVFGFTFPVRRK